MPRLPFSWVQRGDVELLLEDEDDDAERVALDDAASDDGDDDDRAFIALSGGSWERRLTRREKLVRAGGVVAMVLAVALVLVGGPGSVLAYLGNAAQALNPAPVAQSAAPPASNALDVPVPANIAENPQISLSPVNGSDALAFACWVDEPQNDLGERVAALHVAVYAVASHNWALLPPPVAMSAGCTVITDMTVPGSIVLALARADDAGSSCRLPDLDRSGDGGASWVSLPWPSGTLAPCSVRVLMEGGRVYVQGDTRLLPMGEASAGAGLIVATADGGVTWEAVDGGLAGLLAISLVALRPGGRVLAQGIDPQQGGERRCGRAMTAGRTGGS